MPDKEKKWEHGGTGWTTFWIVELCGIWNIPVYFGLTPKANKILQLPWSLDNSKGVYVASFTQHCQYIPLRNIHTQKRHRF